MISYSSWFSMSDKQLGIYSKKTRPRSLIVKSAQDYNNKPNNDLRNPFVAPRSKDLFYLAGDHNINPSRLLHKLECMTNCKRLLSILNQLYAQFIVEIIIIIIIIIYYLFGANIYVNIFNYPIHI